MNVGRHGIDAPRAPLVKNPGKEINSKIMALGDGLLSRPGANPVFDRAEAQNGPAGPTLRGNREAAIPGILPTHGIG